MGKDVYVTMPYTAPASSFLDQTCFTAQALGMD